MPLLIVLAIPLFIALPALYPWPHHPAAIKPDVLSYYLNMPAFIVRTRRGACRLVGARAILLPRSARTALASCLPRLVSSSTRSSSPAYRSTGICRSKRRSLHRPSARASPSPRWSPPSPGRRSWRRTGRRSRHRRSWRLAARDRSRHHLHRFHGRAGDLVRRPSARGNLVCRARQLALDGCLAVAAFILVSLLPILALMLSRVRNARRPAARGRRLRACGPCLLRRLSDRAAVGCAGACDRPRRHPRHRSWAIADCLLSGVDAH